MLTGDNRPAGTGTGINIVLADVLPGDKAARSGWAGQKVGSGRSISGCAGWRADVGFAIGANADVALKCRCGADEGDPLDVVRAIDCHAPPLQNASNLC
jgi:cation transport ATPase